jgi:CPA2 family monovalent cation:H+ antiporter-2
MTVGMNFDLAVLGGALAALVAAAAGLVLLKIAATFAAARGLGSEPAIAAEAAFLLAGAGEFAFVVFTLARRDGLLPLGTYQFLLPLTGLTMLATPGLAGLGRRLAGRIAARRATDRHGAAEAEAELSDHVVIGGFGRVGRAVARVLDSEAIPYVAMDIDPERVAKARADGKPVFYGDVSRREILERVGAARARAFVVTTDDPAVTERMVEAIHAAWPQAAVHARARDLDRAAKLARLGVTDVVPEALEGSLQLAGRVLGGFGLPAEAIDVRLATARNREISRLVEEGKRPRPDGR